MEENNYKPQIPDVMEAIFDAAYLIFDLVAAKTAFLAIDNFIFPSSVHQLFCGNMHITILTTADIHTTASTIPGIFISGNVNFQTYIKII